MALGVVQMITAFMATLLPNEEDEGVTGTGAANSCSSPAGNKVDPCAAVRARAASLTMNMSCSVKSPAALGINCASLSCRGGGLLDRPRSERPDYKCKCPICSRLGGISECIDVGVHMHKPGEC